MQKDSSSILLTPKLQEALSWECEKTYDYDVDGHDRDDNDDDDNDDDYDMIK